MKSEITVTIKYAVNSNQNPADDSWVDVDAGTETFTGDILEVAKAAAAKKNEIKDRFGVDEVSYQQTIRSISAMGEHPDFPGSVSDMTFSMVRDNANQTIYVAGLEYLFAALMLRFM